MKNAGVRRKKSPFEKGGQQGDLQRHGRIEAQRTGAMQSMAEIRVQHDTFARMSDTLTRLYAQHGTKGMTHPAC